jgi:3-oxo-5-alpha-steroid 4-dehydrogenase
MFSRVFYFPSVTHFTNWTITHRPSPRVSNIRPNIRRKFDVHHRHLPVQPVIPLGLCWYLARAYCFSPRSSVQTHDQPVLQFAELSNLSTHLTLRNLRPPGSKKRAIPHGYGFGLLSCPNYFFESVAWAAVAYMTGSWAGASHFLAFCLGC